MSINNNSFSTNTNIRFGSEQLGDLWLNAQSCSIPGIQLAPAKIGGRFGAQVGMGSDRVEYGDLNIDVVIDKEFKVYDIIYDHFLTGLNVEQGTFNPQQFDLWLELYTSKGKPLKKFWFYNCRLNDISEILMDVSDIDDSVNEMSLTFQFDYFDYCDKFFKVRNG